VEKDQRSLEIEEQVVTRINRDRDEKIRTVRESAFRQLVRLLDGKKAAAKIVQEGSNDELLKKGEAFSAATLRKLPFELYERITVEDGEDLEESVWNLVDKVREKEDQIRDRYAAKIERHKKGDELSPGVIKLVKVYVAIKRKLQVGDKMAGRHGNKGVLSRILPEEDMPYLADGTPVDIVLNPLGVPSRMNVGQILETHLGFAARQLGLQVAEALEAFRQSGAEDELRSKLSDAYGPEFEDVFASASAQDLERVASKATRGIHTATPVFDGASEEEIFGLLEKAGLSDTGQSWLFDGKTGDRFSQPVTVGIIYMLKLHHLVDDKIHARSTGPYSLVTQQPLGGKAQFGGQRW
jgi:DNA-directed RNA polymerase subunit beta